MTRYTLKPLGKDGTLVPVAIQIRRGKKRGQTPGAFGGKRRHNGLLKKSLVARKA